MTGGPRHLPRPDRFRLAAVILLTQLTSAHAQSTRYESRLLELSEILGAMHYLQQICERYDTRVWRDQMITLMKVEKARGERKSRMTEAFNRGYSKNQDWFSSCTPGANVKVDQFTREGSTLTTWLSENRQ